MMRQDKKKTLQFKNSIHTIQSVVMLYNFSVSLSSLVLLPLSVNSMVNRQHVGAFCFDITMSNSCNRDLKRDHWALTDLLCCQSVGWLVGWLEFNVPFQHKYGYIREERSGVETGELSSYNPVKEG